MNTRAVDPMRWGRVAAWRRLGAVGGMVAASLAPAPASAAVSVNLDPTRQEFSLAPGATRRYWFKVSNPEERSDLVLSFRVVEIGSSPDGSIAVLEDQTPAWSAVDWISLSRTTLRLRPVERVAVPYWVRVPAGARGGGYAAILVETIVPAKSRTGASVKIAMRVPYVVLVSVRGTEQPSLQLEGIRPGPVVAGVETRPYFVEVSNDGNVLMRPDGVLTVAASGSTVTAAINPRKWAVMPGMSRFFEVPVVVPTVGAFTVTAELSGGAGTRRVVASSP